MAKTIKVRLKADISAPDWLPGGGGEEGDVVTVPAEQKDGSPIIYHPDYYEVLEDNEEGPLALPGTEDEE